MGSDMPDYGFGRCDGHHEMVDFSRRKKPRSRTPAHAFLDFAYLCQAGAEHFQQCAEFLLLRNRGLGALAVAVLPIPLARRATATVCAAVQSTASLFCRW